MASYFWANNHSTCFWNDTLFNSLSVHFRIKFKKRCTQIQDNSLQSSNIPTQQMIFTLSNIVCKCHTRESISNPQIHPLSLHYIPKEDLSELYTTNLVWKLLNYGIQCGNLKYMILQLCYEDESMILQFFLVLILLITYY